MNSRPKILIAGASGFVGTHLAELAVSKGFDVFALVRKKSNTTRLPDSVFLLRGDIRQYDDVVRVIKELKEEDLQMDYIIHAAAITKSNSKEAFDETNFIGTMNLFKAFKEENYQPKKIVFISSLAACGPAGKKETVKEYDQSPITSYGESKLKAEKYIVSSAEIPYLIIRPTAVYGPGEKDLFTVFKIVNKHINPVLGFEEQALTFIYVKDLAELILASAQSEQKNKIYFATDGYTYEKKTLAKEISQALNKKTIDLTLPLSLVKMIAYVSEFTASLTGKAAALNMEKYKELTAESWSCDATPFFKDMQFTPQYNLQKGIKETTQWYKQHQWI